MKRCRLILFRIVLAILLILAVSLFSMRWWSASLANSIVQYLLSKTEYPETKVVIDEIGLGGSRILLNEFKVEGVEVRDTVIDVDYTPQHLWNMRVNEVLVIRPQVILDLEHWLAFQQSEPAVSPSEVTTPFKPPANELVVKDARIQLEDGDWHYAFGANARASLGDNSQLTLNITGETESLVLKAAGNLEKKSGEAGGQVVMNELTHWLALARRVGFDVPEFADQVQFNEVSLEAKAHLESGQLSDWRIDGHVDEFGGEFTAVGGVVEQSQMMLRGVGTVLSELHVSLEHIALANELAELFLQSFSLQSEGADTLVGTLQDWTVAMKQLEIRANSGPVVATLEGPWTEVAQGFSPDTWSARVIAGPAPLVVESGFGNLATELWMQAIVGPGADERTASIAVRLKATDFKSPNARVTAREVAIDVDANVDGTMVQPRQVMADILDAKLRYSDLNFAVQSLKMNNRSEKDLELQSGEWDISGKTSLKELGEVSINSGPMRLKFLGPWTTLLEGFSAADWTLSLESERAPFAFYSGLGSITGDLAISARGEVSDRRIVSSVKLFDGDLNAAGASINTPKLDLLVQGDIGGQLTAGLLLEAASASWSNGAGKLEGLSGWVYPVNLTPPSIDIPQTLMFDRFTQGKLVVEGGEMTVKSYAPVALGGVPHVDAEISANALGGKVIISMKGTVVEPRKLNIRVNLENVDLEALSVLLPKFEGSISGKVSGQLGLQIVGNNKALIPGVLEMTAGTIGHFQFTKQGWMTQDTMLNPVEFVKDKDIVKLMQQPHAASIVTELAMRDLMMTKFRLEIFKPGGPKPAEIQMEGSGSVKGVKIPVVLDVPIRGALLETLNFGLQLQSKM